MGTEVIPFSRASKAEIIIDSEEIDYPEVINADVLVALSQEACDRYASNLNKEGLSIVDGEKVGRVPYSSAIKAPITRLAAEATGKAISANVVALGLLVGLTGLVSKETIEKAVVARAPKGTEEFNCVAWQRDSRRQRTLKSKTKEKIDRPGLHLPNLLLDLQECLVKQPASTYLLPWSRAGMPPAARPPMRGSPANFAAPRPELE